MPISRFRLSWQLIGVALVLALLTRGVIAVTFHNDFAAPPAEIALAFLIGTVYDVLASAWIVAPLVLWSALAPQGLWRRGLNRFGVRTYLAIFAGLVLFAVAAELVFWSEFTGRFNFVAVNYLVFPGEVVNNIWESYPLGPILAGIAVGIAFIFWLTRRARAASFAAEMSLPRRWQRLSAFGLALASLTVAVKPTWARVSSDRQVNELATNGLYTFWLAFLGQDAPYDGLYARGEDADGIRRTRRLVAEPAVDSTTWGTHPVQRLVRNPGPERRLNVVLVLEESFGSTFVKSLHPRDSALSPHFDSLATEGTFFTRAYATGNRTIRALEATTASIPPLPGISIVRRTQSKDLFTLPSLLRSRGYSTAFIYGGRALFDGMGSYMRNNGMERVIDQGEYPADAFKTAWGVADEYIFDRALTYLDSVSMGGRPFFTLILSVSNHRPYTYPKGRIAADPDDHSRDNAVRYADWALGRFMRQARSKTWFDSTLFVLMGDHGARVYGAAEIPLTSYEVPVVFYGPKIIPAGRRIDALTSNMDIAPTILGRLGVTYTSTFFGRDAWVVDTADRIAPMTHNNVIALMRGDSIGVLDLKAATSVYLVRRDSAGGVSRQRAGESSGIVKDAIALYQTADRLYRTGALKVAK